MFVLLAGSRQNSCCESEMKLRGNPDMIIISDYEQSLTSKVIEIESKENSEAIIIIIIIVVVIATTFQFSNVVHFQKYLQEVIQSR